MSDIAPVRVHDAYHVRPAALDIAQPSAPLHPARGQDATPTAAAPFALSLTNPVLEALYTAAYDPRGLSPDTTPRGVEIDRIEMIKEGFDHIRDLIRTISETAAAENGGNLDTRL